MISTIKVVIATSDVAAGQMCCVDSNTFQLDAPSCYTGTIDSGSLRV